MFQNRRKEVLEQFELDLPDLESLKPLETKSLEAVFTGPQTFAEEVVTFRIGVSFENLPAGLQGNKVLVNFTELLE